MLLMLAALNTLNTLAALRSDLIVGSEVAPRLAHFTAHVESTIDAYEDDAPATLRSPRTMSEAFYSGKVSQ